MYSFLTIAKKPIIFMLAASFGCFIAAILAEPLFIPPPLRYIPPPQSGAKFCFTFDDSGSMRGSKRIDVKQAAKDFVNQRDLEHEKFAIVVFSNSSRIFLPLSRDKNQILSIIDSYSDGGGTYFTEALQHSIDVFQNDTDSNIEEKRLAEINEKIKEQNAKDEKRGVKRPPLALQRVPKIVLFFTDGQNVDGPSALQKAAALREKGILLYAISTLDGDKNYLAQMTNDPSRVFMTSDQNIANVFKQVEQEIEKEIAAQGSLLDGKQDKNRESVSQSWERFQAIAWAALLCFGMAVCIVMVQNHLMHKTMVDRTQLVILLVGAIAGGFAAGIAGDTAFRVVQWEFVGRFVGWAMLGAILALGMSFYIANLDRKKALIGGSVGGALGVIGFYLFSLLGVTMGRLIGAAILGACIGLMIGFVEVFYRNVWLMVLYDPRDFTQVNLGSQKVTVGSGKGDTVFIPNASPRAAEFRLEGDKIRFTDANGTQFLAPGSRVHIGGVELVVCSNDVTFAPSKFYPMKMSKAREMSP